MAAISNVKQSIYACNSFRKGPDMLAIVKHHRMVFARFVKSNVTPGPFSTLQAYLPLKQIASRYNPF